jgi:hypothetical protein
MVFDYFLMLLRSIFFFYKFLEQQFQAGKAFYELFIKRIATTFQKSYRKIIINHNSIAIIATISTL